MRRWLRSHPKVATLLLVVAIVAPGYFRQEQAIDKSETASTKAKKAVALLIEQRTEARADNCKTLKSFAEAHNALVESHNTFVLFLATGGGRREVDPEDQEVIDSEIARNNRNIVAVPDCSPEGLAKLPGEPDK